MSETIISVQNLTKSYRLYTKPSDRLKEAIWPLRSRHTLFHALADVSFSVRKGEHLGIIGVNGAGKSTLLQILTGVLSPSSGSVSVTGRVAALLELSAGFNPEMSGRENVRFLTSLLGFDDAHNEQIVRDIEAFAEIGDFINQPVKTYSSGMFARLAFGMNVSHTPDILIVDEALAVGDVFFQQKCLRKMHGYREQGTVLFVSHDTASVMQLCTNVLWLEHGRVKEFGPAREVCERYMASSYSSNFADKNAIREEVAKEVQADAFQEVQGEADAGIRAKEHIHEVSLLTESDFSDKDSFGDGDAEIMRCIVENTTKDTVIFTCGDVCRLTILFRTRKQLSNVITGFILKDRMGNSIFGTNSYRTVKSWACDANKIYAAVMEFSFPDLLTAEYVVTLAIAEGTLKTHRQLHWIHDAFVLNFVSSENDGTIVAAKCTRSLLYGDSCVK